MDYFLQAFGDITVGKAAVVIGAIVFLVVVYKRVEGYFLRKRSERRKRMNGSRR